MALPPDPLLSTARLRLRPLRPGDEAALLAVYGDAEAMRHVGDGQPLDAAQCARWVTVTLQNYALRGYGMFAIEAPAGGKVLGFVGLVHPGGQTLPELKYALHRSAWGQGLASEAAAALRAHGALHWGLAEIIATVAPAHAASQRVLTRAGLQPWQTRRNEDGSDTLVFRWQAAPPAGAPMA